MIFQFVFMYGTSYIIQGSFEVLVDTITKTIIIVDDIRSYVWGANIVKFALHLGGEHPDLFTSLIEQKCFWIVPILSNPTFVLDKQKAMPLVFTEIRQNNWRF